MKRRNRKNLQEIDWADTAYMKETLGLSASEVSRAISKKRLKTVVKLNGRVYCDRAEVDAYAVELKKLRAGKVTRMPDAIEIDRKMSSRIVTLLERLEALVSRLEAAEPKVANG